MEPFQGLKVIELATVLAGPEVGRFFAEQGAAVIKYEPPGGDVTRGWRLAQEDKSSSISAYFAAVNAAKSYATLNLKSEEGKLQLRELLADADILLSNFKVEDEEAFGLDSLELKKLFPQLIWGRVRGFKSDESRPAFDVVLQAETGWMSMTGRPNSIPSKIPVAMIDIVAAHQLKEAILIGLYQRERTGAGSHWEITLEEASLSALANQATNYWMNGHVPKPMGSAHPNIAPYGDLLPTKDGKWAVPAIGSQAQFITFCQLIGADHLPSDRSLRSNIDRVTNRKFLIEELSKFTRSWDSAELSKCCAEDKIPLGIVKGLDEVLDTPTANDTSISETMDGRETKRIRSFVARRI